MKLEVTLNSVKKEDLVKQTGHVGGKPKTLFTSRGAIKSKKLLVPYSTVFIMNTVSGRTYKNETEKKNYYL